MHYLSQCWPIFLALKPNAYFGWHGASPWDCSLPLLQCLWWLPAVPALQKPFRNRLDTCTCPHEPLPAQLPVTLILPCCLQSPSAEVPMAAEAESGHHVGGSASTTCTCLPAWVSPRALLMCQRLSPSIPGVRGWLSHFCGWAITTWSTYLCPAMEMYP